MNQAMNQWKLPTALSVGGKEWEIRTDFRVILDIIGNLTSPDYEPDEKRFICLDSLYIGFSEYLPNDGLRIFMPIERHNEALQYAYDFIDMGVRGKDDGSPKPRLMDWEQDAPIIIPSVNRVLGREIRALPYLHWWTFLSAYMEIRESTFTSVLNIRGKKAKGKKLEKWEREYYKENKALIDLEQKYSEEELAEQERLNKLLG